MTLKYKYQCNSCRAETELSESENRHLVFIICKDCKSTMKLVDKVYYIDEVTIERLLLEMPYVR